MRFVGVGNASITLTRELRRQRVLSMRELEEISGVFYNRIWRLERGKTGAQPRAIRKIAGALGVDPAELVVEGKEGEDAR